MPIKAVLQACCPPTAGISFCSSPIGVYTSLPLPVCEHRLLDSHQFLSRFLPIRHWQALLARSSIMSPTTWKNLWTRVKETSTKAKPRATNLAASTNDTSIPSSSSRQGTNFTAPVRSEIIRNTSSSLPKRYGSPFVYQADPKKKQPFGWVTRIEYGYPPVNSENQRLETGWFIVVSAANSGAQRTFRLEQFPGHLQSLLTSGPRAPAFRQCLKGAAVDDLSCAGGVDTWRMDVRYSNNWTVSPTTHQLQKASASMIARAPGPKKERPSRTRQLCPGQLEKLRSDLGVIVEEP